MVRRVSGSASLTAERSEAVILTDGEVGENGLPAPRISVLAMARVSTAEAATVLKPASWRFAREVGESDGEDESAAPNRARLIVYVEHASN